MAAVTSACLQQQLLVRWCYLSSLSENFSPHRFTPPVRQEILLPLVLFPHVPGARRPIYNRCALIAQEGNTVY